MTTVKNLVDAEYAIRVSSSALKMLKGATFEGMILRVSIHDEDPLSLGIAPALAEDILKLVRDTYNKQITDAKELLRQHNIDV